MEYQGKYPYRMLSDVFDLHEDQAGIVEYDWCINLMKGAIVSADRITTVSPSYAGEIQIAGGYGLEPIIRANSHKLSGIINGIDTELYNPKTDPKLAKNYTADNVEGKAANKAALQKLFNLPVEPRKMLICVVSRLVAHKGIDLITLLMDDLLKLDIQFLMLGTGDYEYELFFEELAHRYPNKVKSSIAFNPEIASKFYAGADVVLMPSRSEPCGLTQMIASRYGTIPIVRKTGGLSDTVEDCSLGQGSGFVFEEYDWVVLFNTIKRAHYQYFYHEDNWKNLMREAMSRDYSWDQSAHAYAALYEELR